MLRKLIKQEWKEISKTGGILLLAVLMVTGIGCVMLQMPWMKSFYEGGNGFHTAVSAIVIVMMVFSLILYVLLLVGITNGLMIYLGIRFYRSMYTEQGYLTHTLPVTPHQLLFSKLLVSGIWYLLVEIGVVLSVLALVLSLVGGIMEPAGLTFGILREDWRELTKVLPSGFAAEYTGTLIHFLIYLILTLLLSPFCSTMIIFGALTIGQLSGKYKALVGVLTYFGINIVSMIIMAIIQVIFTINMTIHTMQKPFVLGGMNMMGVYDGSLIVQVILAGGLYWLSLYILNRKLNLE